jgi:hypothetical protein
MKHISFIVGIPNPFYYRWLLNLNPNLHESSFCFEG